MHRVEISQGNTWRPVNTLNGILYACPESIDTQCGFCGVHGALIIGSEISLNNETNTLSFKARCTRNSCKRDSTVVMTNAANWDRFSQVGSRPEEFWILPAPKLRQRQVKTDDIENKRIVKAYKEAIDSYNENKPSLAISACGRIVEAIGKTKFPNASAISNIGPLYNHLRKEIKSIPDFKGLLEPFVGLGEALRLGRNPGSHFDLEIEPDLELAGKVLDLTEFLLKYIYVIGGEAKEVKELIAKCGPGEPEELDDEDEVESESA